MSELTGSPPRERSLYYVGTVAITLASLGLSRLLFNTIGNATIGVATVGSANICLSLALLSGLPVSAGLAMALSRFVPLIGDEKRITRALRVSTLLGIATVFPLLAVTVWLYVRSLTAPPGWSRLGVIGLWAWTYAQYSIGRAVLFADGAVRRVLALELIGLGLFAVGLGAAAHAPQCWWLPFTLYPLPIAGWSLWRTFAVSSAPRTESESEFLRFASLGLLGSAAGQGIQYGSTLAGASLAGPAGAGVWATLLSLSAPVFLLPRSLNTSYLPRLSAMSARPGADFAQTSREHQRFSGLLALPATVGLMIGGAMFAPKIFPMSAAIDPLPTWFVLCIVTFITCRGEPILTAIAARGKAGINAGATLFAAGLCAATWSLGRSGMQLMSVALGLLVYAIAVPLIAALLARSSLGAHSPRMYPQSSDAIALITLPLIAFGHGNRWALFGAAILAAGVSLYDARYFIRASASRIAS